MQYGLIGSPLKQSHSPRIHALFGNPNYELMSLQNEPFHQFMTEKDFIALNVTLPYKQAILPYIDTFSPRAQALQTVNTVVKRADGTIYGDNTDFAGFAFMARYAGMNFHGKKVLVLGSGGTSTTVCAYLREQGAREIVVVQRNGKVNYDNVEIHHDADFLINTTPVGMYPDSFSTPVDLHQFTALEGVLDVVYNPLNTTLVMQAKDRGINACGGLPMLVEQARLAEEVFFDTKISDSKTLDVLGQMTRELSNIILIGMPGSGKSTLGKQVANALHRRLIDTDDIIMQKTQMDITEIFARYGEETFRFMEEEAVAEACQISGVVIAMGGGAVLREKNHLAMKANGRIYMINRPLENLDQTNRPLSKSAVILRTMQEKRFPLYKELSDVIIQNINSPEYAVSQIEEDFRAYPSHQRP